MVASEEPDASEASSLDEPEPAAAAAPAAVAPFDDRKAIRDSQAASSPSPADTRQRKESEPEPPNPFDRSPEARQRRITQFGGSARTEDAVEAGLNWLAAHQDRDGSWDRVNFMRNCPPDDRCAAPAVERTDSSLRAGITGLALLAFTGAGYTHLDGRHAGTVRGAIGALVRMQQASGGFDNDPSMAGYNDSLGTLALAECLALTHDERLREPVARAAQRLVLTQQPLGGWDYLASNQTGRNDTSITAWAIQALQAAQVAGVRVPPRVLAKAALHLARATDAQGRVWYADAGTGYSIDPKTTRAIYRFGPAMTAAGLSCETILGWRIDGPVARSQQSLLLSQLPSTALLQGRDTTGLHSEYYWYYGTIAMFQLGGESWERWNARLRDALLALQIREKKGAPRNHAFGSWQAFGVNWGKWGRMGGRVYSTALNTLTLEVYYRHTPAYLEDRAVLQARDWREFLQEADPRLRAVGIAALAQMRVEIAEPVLVDLLEDHDRRVAVTAAEALVDLDSPMGAEVLTAALNKLPVPERPAAERAIRRASELAARGPASGQVRWFDPQRGLATVELSHGYVGQELAVRRNGALIARLRIVQRFTGSEVMVAALIDSASQIHPEPGDAASN